MNKDLFVGQFILSPSPIEVRQGWSRLELNGWFLYAENSLPITRLRNASAETVGFLVGYFVVNGEYAPDTVLVEEPRIAEPEWAEKNIYSAGGRWTCILLTDVCKRIYLDPSGSLPVVFDAKTRRVASSSPLLSDALDQQLLDSLQLPDSGLYIPFGVTAHQGITRLLPNHFLELESMSCHRHWVGNRMDTGWKMDEAAAVLADVLKTTVAAVGRKRKICVPLTGGRDSRMLMAACREILDNVEFVTIRTSAVDVDVHLTEVLRKQFGIRHRYIMRKTASEQELKQWQDSVGYCVGGRAWLDHKSYFEFDPQSVLMPSICGEIGRGFFYRKQDSRDVQFSGQDLLLRMKIPRIDVLEKGADSYLQELRGSGLDHFEILDHAYNEQRLGSWAAPTELGGDRFTSGKMWPLCNRRAITVFHETPIEFKLSNELPSRVIDNLWPELNAVPFNKFTGPFGFARDIQRLATRAPKYITDRLRARGLL